MAVQVSDAGEGAMRSPAAVAQRQPAAGALGIGLGLALLVLAVEIGLLAAAVAGLPLSLVLIGHLAAVALLAAVLVRRPPGADTRGLLLVICATAACGPLGAIGALFAAGWLERGGEPAPLLTAWYDRMALAASVDPVTRACEQVSNGRALDTSAQMPTAFVQTMAQGTLSARQSALGLIARRFHPDYVPALRAALESPEPVVRVQAAAVAARVRDEVSARIRTLTANVHGPEDRTELGAATSVAVASALSRAREIEDLAASGLAEPTLLPTAESAVRTLRDRLDGWPGSMGVLPATMALLATAGNDPATRHRLAGDLETVLLERGRACDFRKVRRIARSLARRGARIAPFGVRRREVRRAVGRPVAGFVVGGAGFAASVVGAAARGAT